MPVHDPIPSPSPSLKRRFWRIFRLLALLSVVIALIAVVLVGRGDDSLHFNMLIATGLGTAVTMLLGTSLMTLLFLSSSSGHDEAACHFHEEDE
jgi:uncharacterized BrkB/YihY/UPF0761 family membrane protein